MGLTMLAVAMSALLFGVYGTGPFVVSPLVVGAAAAPGPLVRPRF
jgi:hypothetical protein